MRRVFEVVPAIDVHGGALARLTGEGPRPVAAFGGDPVAAARAFARAGARWLHVVDLDLALDGEARNASVLEEIVSVGPFVQAAGAVRAAEEIRALLAAGATRVVLGSAALADPDATAELLSANGDRLVVGIEVEDGRIRSRGRDPVELALMETLGWLVADDAHAFLVTAVDRVSGLGGPDVASVRRVVRTGLPVLAAGGVASIEHLRALRAAGAAGAVVGRAALEGSVDLAVAFAERD